MNAGHEVGTAEKAVQRITAARGLASQDLDKLTQEVGALDTQIVELNRARPQAPAAVPSKVCLTKKHKRVPCAPDPATGAAVRASDAQIALLKGSLNDERQVKPRDGSQTPTTTWLASMTMPPRIGCPRLGRGSLTPSCCRPCIA